MPISDIGMKEIPLTTGLGEVMAPGTLVTALIVSPDGTARSDQGALHGRSGLERSVRLVTARAELGRAERFRLVWVAVELDASNAPLRYKGLTACDLWVDRAGGLGYKSLAEHVNRMSEAMRGGLNLGGLEATARAAIRTQLVALGSEVWERSGQPLKEALS